MKIRQPETPLRRLGAVVLVLASMPFAVAAPAQTYPVEVIRIVVPLPPGGSNDLVSRLVAEKMTASTGQPVLVDNRPGASAIIDPRCRLPTMSSAGRAPTGSKN
jgi:hypothetical protein